MKSGNNSEKMEIIRGTASSSQGTRTKMRVKKEILKNKRTNKGLPEETQYPKDSLATLLSSNEKTFQKSYDNVCHIINEKIEKKARDEIFSELEPKVECLLENLKLLKNPQATRVLGEKETERLMLTYHNKIGLAYLVGYRMEKAKHYFALPIQHGSLPAMCNMVSLITLANDNEYKLTEAEQSEAYYTLLNKPSKEKNIFEAYLLSNVHEALYQLITRSLKEDSKKLENLIKNYFSLMDFDLFKYILKNINEQSEQYTFCCKKLIQFFQLQKSIPNNQIQFFISALKDAINSLIKKRSYLETILLIESSMPYMPVIELAEIVDQILRIQTPLKKNFYERAKRILLKLNKNDEALGLLVSLQHCITPDGTRTHPIFTANEAHELVEKALAHSEPELQSIANFIKARMYDYGVTVDQSDEKALHHYKVGADLQNAECMSDLGEMFATGQGIAIDITKAIEWKCKAFEAGCAGAGIDIIALLEENQHFLASKEIQQLVQHIADQFAMKCSNEKYDEDKQEYLQYDFYNAYGNYKYIMHALALNKDTDQTKWADAITLFEKVIQCKYASLRLKGYLNLSNLYLGMGHSQSIDKSETYILEAIALSKITSTDVTMIVYMQLTLSYIYNKRIKSVEDVDKKKYLQQKSLMHYETARAIGNESTTKFMKFFEENLLINKSSDESSQLGTLLALYKTIGQRSDLSLKIILSELEERLSQPNSIICYQDIQQLTQAILVYDENFIQYKAWYARLVKIAERVSFDAHHFSTQELIKIIQDISRWHIAPAIDQLKPLFLSMISSQLSPEEQAHTFCILASSNLAPDDLALFVEKLFGEMLKDVEFLSKKLCLLNPSMVSRMLYAFALFDVVKSFSAIESLALDLARFLQQHVRSLNHIELSQAYHALYYFRNKYPRSFSEINKDLFAEYEIECKADKAVNLSKTQLYIYDLLKKRNPHAKHEAFIPEAGRRVDFLIGKTVIQYHGTFSHYLYDASGQIARLNIKDKLCEETLRLADYQVIIIDHESWGKLDCDEEVAFLKNRIPNLIPSVRSLFVESKCVNETVLNNDNINTNKSLSSKSQT